MLTANVRALGRWGYLFRLLTTTVEFIIKSSLFYLMLGFIRPLEPKVEACT
jgi:hypothetical protein